MKKFATIAITALLATGMTVGAASAKKMHRSHKNSHAYGMSRASGPFTGNAAMSGNNGNSGQGSNSLGHIQGGNIGGGK
ncbi:MAG: hypothetical protein ABW213_03830 [Tardiphaga sp.]